MHGDISYRDLFDKSQLREKEVIFLTYISVVYH